jgi:hypothetical protein
MTFIQTLEELRTVPKFRPTKFGHASGLTDCFGVMSGAEQKFRGTVPKGDDDWVEICQRFERRVEETGKPHVGDLDAATLLSFSHHQNVGRFLKTKQTNCQRKKDRK